MGSVSILSLVLDRREVSVASELVVEIRDLGGAGTSKAAARAARRALSEDPGGDAMQHTRFLGRAEVPLAATLAASNGNVMIYCTYGRCSKFLFKIIRKTLFFGSLPQESWHEAIEQNNIEGPCKFILSPVASGAHDICLHMCASVAMTAHVTACMVMLSTSQTVCELQGQWLQWHTPC